MFFYFFKNFSLSWLIHIAHCKCSLKNVIVIFSLFNRFQRAKHFSPALLRHYLIGRQKRQTNNF